MSIHIGTRLRAVVDFQVQAMVHWKASMTSGARCSVKRGTIFRVYSVSSALLVTFSATLEDAKLEEGFVGTGDFSSSSYAGLSFVFDASDVGARLEQL